MLQNLQNLQNFAKFQKFQLHNLVDFEKCCKTHILNLFSCKNQCRYSRKRATFCRNFAKKTGNYPTAPRPAPPAPGGAAARRSPRPWWPPAKAAAGRRARIEGLKGEMTARNRTIRTFHIRVRSKFCQHSVQFARNFEKFRIKYCFFLLNIFEIF